MTSKTPRNSHRWVAVCLCLLALPVCTAGGVRAEQVQTDAWELWAKIYDSRGNEAIKSAQLSYLRRLYSVSGQTGEERRFPVALESYTVQGDRYLIESTEFQDPGEVPLDRLDMAALVPTTISTYFWDGEKLVTFTRQPGEEETVAVSHSPSRVPDFASFGRGSARMPSAEYWATALGAMDKKLTISETDTGGRKLLTLRSGLEDEPGYYLEVLVDPALDNAILGSTTKLDGIVIIEERYRDFSEFSGLYVPREVTRRNFRLGPSGKSSSLSSMEEFLLVGNAKLNRDFSSADLTRPIPKDVDRFEQDRAGGPGGTSTR